MLPSSFSRSGDAMTDTTASSFPSDPSEPVAVTFPTFVLSLVHAAATHFGDIADPHTGRPGLVNLPAAQQIIDILAMLEQKTRGNLTAEERQLIDQVLDELRARYAEETGPAAGPQPDSRIILP
jgi:hypothetical protein